MKQLIISAIEIQTDPRIIINEMSDKEFLDWLEIVPKHLDKKVVWQNLLELLIEHEMYEKCALVRYKLKEF